MMTPPAPPSTFHNLSLPGAPQGFHCAEIRGQYSAWWGEYFAWPAQEEQVTGVPQLLTITFCLDGSGGAGAKGVKVEVSVGLHLIRGYEFWGRLGNVL